MDPVEKTEKKIKPALPLRRPATALALLLVLTACSNDAFKSYLEQERTRQRETSAALAADYKKLNGTWETSPQDKSPWLIKAQFRSMPALKDGASYVPQTVLRGSLTLVLRPELVKKQQEKEGVPPPSGDDVPDLAPDPIQYAFTNGIYDSATGDFAARIASATTDGINISCHYTEPDTLSCNWLPGPRAEEFQFELIKK